MVKRLLAVLVSAASGAYLAIGLYGLLNATDMATLLGLAAHAYGQSFDQTEWLRHWRTGSGLAVVAGLLGLVSGIGMFSRRFWAFVLWASLMTRLFAIYLVSYFFGPATYAFEVVEPAEVLFLGLLTVVSWFLFAHVRRARIRAGAA